VLRSAAPMLIDFFYNTTDLFLAFPINNGGNYGNLVLRQKCRHPHSLAGADVGIMKGF
jgi:hypothetical protein